jgi:hypothetical protein
MNPAGSLRHADVPIKGRWISPGSLVQLDRYRANFAS